MSDNLQLGGRGCVCIFIEIILMGIIQHANQLFTALCLTLYQPDLLLLYYTSAPPSYADARMMRNIRCGCHIYGDASIRSITSQQFIERRPPTSALYGLRNARERRSAWRLLAGIPLQSYSSFKIIEVPYEKKREKWTEQNLHFAENLASLTILSETFGIDPKTLNNGSSTPPNSRIVWLLFQTQ